MTMQRKVQQTAAEKLAEATEKATMAAHNLNERATGQWDKLENIFEDRVAKALHRMGMPSAQDLHDLQARIATLEAQLGVKTTATKKPATKTKPAAAKK